MLSAWLDLLQSRVAWLLASIGVVAGLVMLDGWRIEEARRSGDRVGFDRARAECMHSAVEASERARKAEADAAGRVAKMEAEHARRQMDNERDAAGARAELERLRDALSRTGRAHGGGGPEDAGAATAGDGSSAAAVVAGQCAEELVRVAEGADAIGARLTTLQAYVREVCAPSMAGSDSQRP